MSTRAATAVPSISGRHGFAFAPGGHRGVSIGIAGAATVLETWDLASGESPTRAVPDLAVRRDTSVLPFDDGSVILLRRCGSSSRRHVISMHGGDDGEDVTLGSITAEGAYLLPGPDGALAVAIDTRASTLWRLTTRPPGAEPVLRVPGVLSGGAWIDRGRFALNRTQPGGCPHGIVVDLPQKSWRCVWSVSDASSDRILLYAPATRLLVVSSNSGGDQRLGVGTLGDGTIRFPEVLHRAGYPRNALAVDEQGERVLVHEAAGALSRLFVYTPSDDRLTPLSSPRGVVKTPACWKGDLLRIPFSCPSRPPGIATVRLDGGTARWSLPRATASVGAELVEVAGADGPIEAIAYPRPSRWRREHARAQQLVVALHGGPMSAWRFEFDPLFQSLASTGSAVIAPNCRGSTGYGPRHMPIPGTWGGPDLDDVRTLGRRLARDRTGLGLPPPIVLGASYGAYLALLAACADPHLWSGCVALAPFLSPVTLHAAAGDGVRDRIRALGGLDESTEDRDVLRRCTSLRGPLLLVHGKQDERIPIQQSRTLRRRLLELGRTDLDYLELDTDHAGVVTDLPPHLLDRIQDFCRTHSTACETDAAEEVGTMLEREWGEHYGTRPVRHGGSTA